MSRIGVFVCHCGENIGRTVDCAAVAEALKDHPGVAHAEDYKYMCSDPGQQLVKKAIEENHLTGVVVAACSPHMHEKTFRRAADQAGLNKFMCEMANIREHCSWIHEDRDEATAKAIDIGRTIIEKVKHNKPLEVDQDPGHQARPGHRRRHRRHPGGPGHRRRRARGHPHREGSLHRRPHEPAERDVPHPGLLAVHPHPAHGRGVPAPQHQAPHLERGGEGRRLHRQLRGHGAQEGAVREPGPVQRVRRLHGGLPVEEDPQRVRRGAQQPHRHLRAVPAGGAQPARARPPQLQPLQGPAPRASRRTPAASAKRRASRAPSTTTPKTSSWSRRSGRS